MTSRASGARPMQITKVVRNGQYVSYTSQGSKPCEITKTPECPEVIGGLAHLCLSPSTATLELRLLNPSQACSNSSICLSSGLTERRFNICSNS